MPFAVSQSAWWVHPIKQVDGESAVFLFLTWISFSVFSISLHLPFQAFHSFFWTGEHFNAACSLDLNSTGRFVRRDWFRSERNLVFWCILLSSTWLSVSVRLASGRLSCFRMTEPTKHQWARSHTHAPHTHHTHTHWCSQFPGSNRRICRKGAFVAENQNFTAAEQKPFLQSTVLPWADVIKILKPLSWFPFQQVLFKC